MEPLTLTGWQRRRLERQLRAAADARLYRRTSAVLEIGDAAGAQGVEEVLVVAAEFDVLQAGAVTEGVVGDVEDVVGIVVGEVPLEDVQPLVDGINESELAGQGVQGADTAVGDAACACGDLIVDVGGGKHRSGATTEVGLVEPALDAALAVIQPPS